LSAAAAHRQKTAERLAADIIEGTAFLGDIETQASKATAYKTGDFRKRQQQKPNSQRWTNLSELSRRLNGNAG
jgi:hypothetical protein